MCRYVPGAFLGTRLPVLGTAFAKFLEGVYNTKLPPTVALENITEVGYIIYVIHLWSQRYWECRYLDFVRTVQAFMVIAAFLNRLAKKGHATQKLFNCLWETVPSAHESD